MVLYGLFGFFGLHLLSWIFEILLFDHIISVIHMLTHLSIGMTIFISYVPRHGSLRDPCPSYIYSYSQDAISRSILCPDHSL